MKGLTTMGKRFTDIESLIQETTDSPTHANEIMEGVANARKDMQLADMLISMRMESDLTQSDIAESLGCNQSKISKLENTSAENMRLCDIAAYANACEYNTEILMQPKRRTAVDRIKHHAFELNSALEDLADLGEQAASDKEFTRAIRKFYHQTTLNLGILLGGPLRRLKECLEQDHTSDKEPETRHIQLSPKKEPREEDLFANT